VGELAERLADPDLVIFDCRFDLGNPDGGQAAWEQAHIPGARYAHLDRDLAAPVSESSGRHPLPDASAFARFLASAGWQPGKAIVAYDAQGGAFSARLWWLMKYFGHDCVGLLDGGLDAWNQQGLALEAASSPANPVEVTELTPDGRLVVDSGEIANLSENSSLCLLDARDSDRFAGLNESIDPVAGHVPGAINRPFRNSLLDSKHFREPDTLKQDFEALISGAHGESIHMCGSGVTACHNLFAMEYAGMTAGRLYPGSWSEWIRDQARPVATGAA
jgi:thiosulfate/3-mercaptopyruvate sulfurtransferase